MSLKAKRKVVSSIPPMDGGTYMGVCVAVVDLGQQYKQFEKQKQGKYAEECMFIFEIPDERVEVDGEDKPRWLSSRRFTVSLHERAALFQMLKAGVPVYMSEGTAAAHKDAMDAANLIKAGEALRFGHLTVVPFRTYHNVEEPLGFLIADGRTKERLLWAVDTANLGVTADRLTYIAVECNYEESLLNRSDRIPSVLKERIRHSHFEVSDVIKWLHKQDLSGVLTIWLLHLSAGNSRAEAWQRRFEREFPGIEIRICPE